MNRLNLGCLGLSVGIAIAVGACTKAEAQDGETHVPKTIHVQFVGERGWTFEGDLERGSALPDCGSDTESVGVVARSVRVGSYAGCVLVVDWPGRKEQWERAIAAAARQGGDGTAPGTAPQSAPKGIAQ